MKKVGLYFGSFNPVHNTHKFVANFLLEKNYVDEIQIVVSPQNPFKTELCDFEKRCDMCDIAFSDNDKISVNRIEETLPKPSYTIDTLQLLETSKSEDEEFYLIMGLDNLDNISKWKNYKEILLKYPIIVLPRIYDASIYDEYEQFYHIRNKMIGEYRNLILVRDLVATDLSASFIRDSIKNEQDVSTFIDKEVYNYIKENNLYK